ncbi:Tetratricopeptide repeat protein [uncultured Gammaproteobacteria bacterium]
MKRILAAAISALLLVVVVPALALTAEEVQSAYYRSYGYERTQAYDDAIKALIPVADAYPHGYTVNLRLGWLYYLRAGHANAITHYRRALDAIPASLEARLGLLNPLLAFGRNDEAFVIVQQMLAVDRFNYYGNLRLAGLLHLQGKLDQAERVSRDMLALFPSDVSFLVELGSIKGDQGDAAAAALIFGDVLVLDPENIVARRFLKTKSPKPH